MLRICCDSLQAASKLALSRHCFDGGTSKYKGIEKGEEAQLALQMKKGAASIAVWTQTWDQARGHMSGVIHATGGEEEVIRCR
jgi:hypothetical protein